MKSLKKLLAVSLAGVLGLSLLTGCKEDKKHSKNGLQAL